MENAFLKSISRRRSIYNLGNKLPISDSELIKEMEDAVRNTPSAFNSQSARVVLLLKDNHQKLWNIVKETLKRSIPAENLRRLKQK